MSADRLSPADLAQFRRLSTCLVASSIETFNVRLRNSGFADASIRCFFPELAPIIGYAATVRIRSADPPMEGHSYYDRTDWWNYLLTVPAPRIVVIEDIDSHPGLGAFIGEVHANILQALGCAGVVTNGGVRDLPHIQKTGFQLFAGNVSVSHAFAHLFDFGGNVAVGGLKVQPGDLIHGDLHGVQTIPLEIAGQIPARVEEIRRKRQRLIEICRSADFSLEKLSKAVKETKS